MVLREMLRHEPLARTLLYSDRSVCLETVRICADSQRLNRFYDFIDYIEQTTFGIACDAQANFKASFFRGSSARVQIHLFV